MLAPPSLSHTPRFLTVATADSATPVAAALATAALAAAEPGAADATDPVATADGATPVATAVTAAAEPAALAAPPYCPPAAHLRGLFIVCGLGCGRVSRS